MQWTIKQAKLKSLGYEFLKLFADNRKVYYKKVDDAKFWLYVRDKQMFITFVGGARPCPNSFVRFFQSNANILESGMPIKMQANSESGEVRILDNAKFNELMGMAYKSGDRRFIDVWYQSNKDWDEFVVDKSTAEAVICEIKLLTA
jgi:hypothetical protein